jgi:hypothetical protein
MCVFGGRSGALAGNVNPPLDSWELVALTISSWNQILQSLQQMDVLRREGLFRAA